MLNMLNYSAKVKVNLLNSKLLFMPVYIGNSTFDVYLEASEPK